MNTTEKTLLGTAAFAAGSAVGTFFAGRAAWRGINKAKPVGLIVLAIVAYHSFDTYRASVDNAWSKVETVMEQRTEKAKAEADATAEAKRASDVEQLLSKAAVLIEQEAKEKKAAQQAKVAQMTKEMERLAEVAKASGKQHDIKVAMAAWDDLMDYAKPLVEADGNRRVFEAQRVKARAEILALITPKPKPVTEPALLAELNAKPKAAPKPAPVSAEDRVAEARQQYDKATKIYNEVGGGSVAYKQWADAKDNLARALMAK